MSGGGGSSEIKETPEQRELATIAMNMLQQQDQDWGQFMREYTADVRDTAREQRLAGTIAGTETARAFGAQAPRVEAAQTAAGARPGSGRFSSAAGGLATDRGQALGAGLMDARQMVDDARIGGLRNIAAIGMGQQAQALGGLANVAARSADTARINAEEAAGNRAALQQAIGTAGLVGYGAYKEASNPLNPDTYAIGGWHGPKMKPY